MTQLRRLIIALAAICVLALVAFALVNRPAVPAPSDDDIIIKGGSLEIDCGKNQGADCFGGDDIKAKPKHKKDGKIVQIIVRKSNGSSLKTFTMRDDFPDGKPIIQITYRIPKAEDN
jgi:hypothetical protein